MTPGQRLYVAWCRAFGWVVEWQLLETSKRERFERCAGYYDGRE
jgi:hypothetical protein